MADESFTSLGLRARSGLSVAPSAGNPAVAVSSAAGAESDGTLLRGSIGSASRGGPNRPSITNPWNLFQHANRQRGLTSTALAKMYKEQVSTEH